MTDLLTGDWIEALRRGEVDATGLIIPTSSMDDIRPLANHERMAIWAMKWHMGQHSKPVDPA